MTRQLLKPYIFLSENYLKQAVDSNNENINVNISSNNLPYSLTLYFTDRYGNPVNRRIDTLVLKDTNIQNCVVSYYTGAAPYTLYAWTFEGHTIYTKNYPITADIEPLFNADGSPYAPSREGFECRNQVIFWQRENRCEYDNDNDKTILGYDPYFMIENNTESTIFIKKDSAIETPSLQIDIPSVDNPAEIKGRFGVYGFICNLCALTDSNYKNEANAGGYRVVNGDYIHYFDYRKWSAKVKMENLAQDQFTLLSEQAQNIGEITAIPYQDLFMDAVYECAVNPEISYGLNRKTELFDLELELNEL